MLASPDYRRGNAFAHDGWSGKEILLSRIPSFVSSFIILTMCVPCLRKHIVLVISIVSFLCAASTGWAVYIETPVWVRYSLEQLTLVPEQLVNNEAAMQELRSHLHRFHGQTVLILQFLRIVFGVPLLFLAGFRRSTLWACLLQPIAFGAGLLIIPDLRLDNLSLVLGCSCCNLAIFMITMVIIRRDTLSQRQAFFQRIFFEVSLDKVVRSSRKADSILNHSLKNQMADGSGAIELFLETVNMKDPKYAPLHDATICLQRGMRACRQRHAYLQLAAGDYVLSLHTVALETFARQITAGRDIVVDVPSLRVNLDLTLLSLIFDSAISNAFKHGHPANPQVKFTIRQLCVLEKHPKQMVMLSFQVTNVANPARPAVTPEYIAKVLKGEAKASSGPSTSAMSDQIGLQHSYLAAKAHDMSVSFTQTGCDVQFEAQVKAEVVEMPEKTESARESTDLSSFPPNLKICYIDDSATARRLVHHNLVTLAETKDVKVFGNDATEVNLFIEEVLSGSQIAILDQHLEYGGDDDVFGTDIVKRLIKEKFQGLICMRSANTSHEDRELYTQAGAHCSFGKEMLMKDMIKELKAAYLRVVVERQASTSGVDLGTHSENMAASNLGNPLAEAMSDTCTVQATPVGGLPNPGTAVAQCAQRRARGGAMSRKATSIVQLNGNPSSPLLQPQNLESLQGAMPCNELPPTPVVEPRPPPTHWSRSAPQRLVIQTRPDFQTLPMVATGGELAGSYCTSDGGP